MEPIMPSKITYFGEISLALILVCTVQYEVPRVGKLDPIEMIRAYSAAYFGGPGSCAVPYNCYLFRWPGRLRNIK